MNEQLAGQKERMVSVDALRGLAMTPNGSVMHRWAGAAAAQSEARLAIQRQAKTTTYEWAIPWKELGLAQPVAGAILGMSFIAPDADEDRDANY